MSCYGNDGVGDDNDVWRLVVKGLEDKEYKEGEERPTIQLLSTQFKLVHKNMVCGLQKLKRVERENGGACVRVSLSLIHI